MKTLLAVVAIFLVTAAWSARAHAEYGAIAIAETGRGYCTGQSYGFTSQALADQGALQSCAQAGAHCTNCVVRIRYGRRQCRYRTTGDSAGFHCVGVAATPQRALYLCQTQGCSCIAPLGSCNR